MLPISSIETEKILKSDFDSVKCNLFGIKQALEGKEERDNKTINKKIKTRKTKETSPKRRRNPTLKQHALCMAPRSNRVKNFDTNQVKKLNLIEKLMECEEM